MRISDITPTHQKILYNIFNKYKDSKIIDIGTGGGRGASMDILHNLGIKPDGIDILKFPGAEDRFNTLYNQNIYEFQGYSNYDVAIMCDITYIFECDPFDKVTTFFTKLLDCCKKTFMFVPYFDRESNDYLFQSSVDSPVKKIIRPMFFENVTKHYPMFKTIVAKKPDVNDTGYGIYESR